uniref:RNA1 polyprotein n=1 Tax=Senecio pinnatifolius nepovirus TaxID=3115776 RepID=A0AAT9JAX3_9SECO
MRCITPYLAQLHGFKEEIEKFWTSCSTWARNLWSEAHIALQALGKYAIWAMVVYIMCGIMYIIEKILIALSILSSHGMLLTIFLTCMMTGMGFSVWYMGQQVQPIIRAMRQCVLSQILPDGTENRITITDSEEMEPQSIADSFSLPIKALEALTSGLCSLSISLNGTVTSMGKLGNALEGVRKGYRCLSDFMCLFFEKCGGAWEYISGTRSAFFQSLAAVVKVDITRWTKEARKLVEYHEIAGNLDQFEFTKVRSLIYDGEKLLDTASKGRTSATNIQFTRVVSKLVDELKKVRAESARSLKFPGWRRQPFWIYLHGSSQCGKSTFANHLVPQLLMHMGVDPSDSYSKDPSDEYWSNYFQQTAIKINDLSAIDSSNKGSIETKLIPLISTEECSVSAAAVEAKGMQFMSEIIVTTSNVFDAPTTAGVLDIDAYRRRRSLVLECRRAVEYVHNADGTKSERRDAKGDLVYHAYDPNDLLHCVEVRSIGIEDANPKADGDGGRWTYAEDMVQYIKDSLDKHFVKEDAKMANWRESTGVRSRSSAAIGSYFNSLCNILPTLKKIEHPVSEDGRQEFLLAVDRKVYKLVDNNKFVPFEGNFDSVDTLEHLTKTLYRTTYAQYLKNFSGFTQDDSFHCQMSNTIIQQMIDGLVTVKSVDEISADSSEDIKEIWKEFYLGEKIFLRVTQIALNELRLRPGFNEDVKSRFLEAMRGMRDTVVDNRQGILLFMTALLCTGLFCYSFWALFKVFTGSCTSFGAGLAVKHQLDSHSVISSGSIDSIFSKRNIPVVWAGRAMNAQTGVDKNFDFLKDGLGHLMVRIVATTGQTETAMMYGPRTLALCEHQTHVIPAFDRVQIHYFTKDQKPSMAYITWHPENVFTFKDTEVALYRDDQLAFLPTSVGDVYLTDAEKLGNVLTINGISMRKRKTFSDKDLDSTCVALGPEEPIVRSWHGIVHKATKAEIVRGKYADGEYVKEVPRCYIGSYPSVVHDSGGIITTMHNGRRKVLGLHAGGAQNMLSNKAMIALLPDNNFISAQTSPDYYVPATGIEKPGYAKCGWIAEHAKRPHVGGKNSIAKIEESLCIPLPDGVEVKIPSILNKKDPRLAEVPSEFKDYDPLKDGMSKFEQPMALLDDDLLSEVCSDIGQTWEDCLPYFDDERQYLEKTTLDVALNGIDGEQFYDAMRVDTSEGYPYVLERKQGDKGKERYIFVDDYGRRSLIEGTSVYKDYHSLSKSIYVEVPVLNCVECPKDECLKREKVLVKPKTRLFDTLPFVHNILLREYFLPFCVHLQGNRYTLPTQVGINPYSREWTMLYDRLASKNDRALNCDYSRFDGLISHQVYMHMVRTINSMFKDGPEANTARRNLFSMFIGRRSICYDQVYMVNGGMPSGCSLTVIINSILNEILIRYVYKKFVPTPSRNYFCKYVTLLVYGDDNLISIDPSICTFFNGPLIKSCLAEYNITITDGTDKNSQTLEAKPLLELDFLKRGFRLNDVGLCLAPLDKTSLYTRLHYSTMGPGGVYQLDLLCANVKSFLEELVLHEDCEKEFARVRNFYVTRIPNWSAQLPSLGDARASMQCQLTEARPYIPHKFQETRVDVDKVKHMMKGQDDMKQYFSLVPRISICGFLFRDFNTETTFVVSIDNPLAPNETGKFVKSSPGKGHGYLSEQSWVDAFGKPSKHKDIFEAYAEGKTIMFRSRMPYYWAWCAAIRFAQAQKYDKQGLLDIYHRVKLEGSGDIAPLLAEPEYKRRTQQSAFLNALVKKNIE